MGIGTPVTCFLMSVVSRDSLEHLHSRCVEALADLDEPPQEQVLSQILSSDGDSVISADDVLDALPEQFAQQFAQPVEVRVMFRWMWSWPLDTPTELLIEIAQRQFNILAEDGGRRSRLIQSSLQILSIARMTLVKQLGDKTMAMMKTIPCSCQSAVSDSGDETDTSDSDYGDDPDLEF